MSCTYLSGIETMRFTRLDACGRPVCAEDSAFVTSCVASLTMTANTDEGDEIQYKASNGTICAYQQRCPVFKNFSVEAQILFASPELFDIVTNSPRVYDYAGNIVGFESGNVTCQPFALEAWINTLGAECTDTGEGTWLYILLPFLTGGVLGDLEIADGATNFTVSGSTRAGGSWATGPYDVVAQDAANTPGPLLAPLDSSSHRLIQLTSVAPPEPSCDYQPVLCSASS